LGCSCKPCQPEGNLRQKTAAEVHKDFGTTAGQCTTRVGSSVGVSKPRYKPGSKDSCVVEAMLVLCRYTKNASFKWMPKGMRPYNCDDLDDPRNKFAQRIHQDCFIPASRVGLTNLEQPCRYHCDEMNSKLFQYQCVPTLSSIVVINGKRSCCAVIGYSRRSGGDYLVAAGSLEPIPNSFATSMRSFTTNESYSCPPCFRTDNRSLTAFQAFRY
jgi:hypothetical protein